MRLIVPVFIFFFHLPFVITWEYSNQDGWSKDAKICGNGKMQSPINIPSTCKDSQTTSVNGDLKLEYTGYDQPISQTNLALVNNGHSAQLNLKKAADGVIDQAPKVSGSAVPGTFQFSQLHFHWHLTSKTDGTEHAIDDGRHALELHLVHWNTKYPNMKKAVPKPDGLLVLAVLFDVQSSAFQALKPITDQLDKVIESDSTTTIKQDIKLIDLLPKKPTSFYKYAGSLTTPPCAESVTWIVFTSFGGIGQGQLKKFRALKDHHGDTFSNVRRLQDLNGRKIEVSEKNC